MMVHLDRLEADERALESLLHPRRRMSHTPVEEEVEGDGEEEEWGVRSESDLRRNSNISSTPARADGGPESPKSWRSKVRDTLSFDIERTTEGRNGSMRGRRGSVGDVGRPTARTRRAVGGSSYDVERGEEEEEEGEIRIGIVEVSSTFCRIGSGQGTDLWESRGWRRCWTSRCWTAGGNAIVSCRFVFCMRSGVLCRRFCSTHVFEADPFLTDGVVSTYLRPTRCCQPVEPLDRIQPIVRIGPTFPSTSSPMAQLPRLAQTRPCLYPHICLVHPHLARPVNIRYRPPNASESLTQRAYPASLALLV
jgi:hypothetical protein